MKDFDNACIKASSSIFKFGNTLKNVFANVGIMLAINIAIKAATKIWDNFDTTVDETQAKLEETQSVIASLEEQIKELESIDANALTQGQKDKLDNLKEQLEVQKQLEEIEKRRLARERIGNGNWSDRFDEDSYAHAAIDISTALNDYGFQKGVQVDKFNNANKKVDLTTLTYNSMKANDESEESLKYAEFQMEKAIEEQRKTQENILELQNDLITQKGEVQSWITEIQGYIDDGSLVGSDLTDAEEKIKSLNVWLEYINGELEYTNTLLYGGDDSWQSVLSEKTKYSLDNLLDNGFTEEELQVLATLTFDKNASLIELREVLEAGKETVNNYGNEMPIFNSFDDTNFGERIQHITDQLDNGELAVHDYFNALNSEIQNFDASNFTDSLEDANNAAAQFFTDNVQQTASGLSDLINSFSNGEMSISEYLEGYLAIGNTLSTLTDELQENSAEWDKNGQAISNSANTALDNTQVKLQSAMNTIKGYQDSIYSLEQILTNTVQEGSDEFNAHAQVIAQDLDTIVANGGAMANEVANTLGTTTSEIAKNMTLNVANQELACQAIMNNTNTAIESMATSIGELFDNLGDAISNFKIDISFSKTSGSLLGAITGNDPLKFSLDASGESLSSIGKAISGLGDMIVSNLDTQKLELEDFHYGSTESGKNDDYIPNSNITKNYKNALDGIKDSSSSAKNEFKETIDFFEERIENLDDALSHLDASLENVSGSFAKNKLISAQIDLNAQKINEYSSAIEMYSQKANEALTSIPENLRDKVVNGAISLDTFVGENGEQVTTAIEEYNKWADKISECNQQLVELQETIAQLSLDKFKNIEEDFTNQFDIRDNTKSLIDKQISLLEESGKVVDESLYEAQISQTEKQLEILNAQKKALAEQINETLTSGRVQEGSDEWLEMTNAITEVDANIIDCKTSIEELNNSITELEIEKFNRIEEHFTDMTDVLDDSNSMIEKQISLLEESGKVVDESLFTTQIENEEKKLTFLKQKQEALMNQMTESLASGKIEKGSEEWDEMTNSINEVNEAILESKIRTQELNNTITELEVDKFERIEEHYTKIQDVMDASNDLIQKQIASLEASDTVIDGSLYEAQIKNEEKKLLSLVQERENLENQLTESLSSGKIKKGSDEWHEMTNTINEIDGAILDCQTNIAELHNTIEDLEVEKFNRIADHFEELSGVVDNSSDSIQKQMDLLKESGEIVGKSYYTAQIENEQRQLELLEQKKIALTKQLNDSVSKGLIEKGSDEWLSMMEAINETDSAVLDCKISIESLNNDILNLNWQTFELVQKEFSNLNSELENILGLFDGVEISDENGKWTDDAISQMGLLSQQYELALTQANEYKKAIEDLEADYKAGKYSATEYSDKLAELNEGLWDSVNASESAKDAMMELHKSRVDKAIEGIEKEKEAYKELVDAQIESIEKQEELDNYKKDVEEQNKVIESLEKRIAAMRFDTSASSVAKRKQLEEELVEAKKELEELQHNHSIEVQKDALNKEYENFEKEKDDEIEELEKSLDEQEKLISDSFQTVKQNSEIIGKQIAEIAEKHGLAISDTLITAWKSGENAIDSYGVMLGTQSSAFISNLSDVQNNVYKLNEEADLTASALTDMFSTQSDTLISELEDVYAKENELINKSSETQQSLAIMFDTQSDSLIVELNDVYNAENEMIYKSYETQNALANMLSTQSDMLITELADLYNAENEVANKSYETQNALADMFSVTSDGLIEQLTSSYNSIDNVNTMAEVLNNTLSDTLSGTYNVSGITSALDNITSAANSAKEALDRVNNTPTKTTDDKTTTKPTYIYSYTGAIKNKKRQVDVYTSNGNYVTTVYEDEAKSVYKATLKACAKGGIVTKEDDGIFNSIAKSVGEDTMVAVKYGESILTKEQTKMLKQFADGWNKNRTVNNAGDTTLLRRQTNGIYDFSAVNPSQFLNIQPNIVMSKMPEIVRRQTSAPTLEFNGTLMHIDKVDSTNIKQMENIANKAVDRLVNRIHDGMIYKR